MPAITAVIYVCYIKVAMNNICGICWLVLLCFFSRPYIPAVCPAPDGRCFAGRVRLLRRQQLQALCCKTPLCLHGAWGSFTAGAVPLKGEPVGGTGLEVCLPHY